MKYLFKRDTFLATCCVFIFIALIRLLPINTHIFDPIKASLSDVKFSDLAFSKFGKNGKPDDRIIIVNIGDADRSQIGEGLKAIKAYQPKVIGLDVLFLEYKTDTAADLLLSSLIKETPNLVLADKLTWVKEKPKLHGIFLPVAHHIGYINFIGEDGGVIRSYSPFESHNDTNYKSFSSAILEQADDAAYKRLVNRDKPYETINYMRSAESYIVLSLQDILENKVDSAAIRNKIVIIGYSNQDPNNIEDKHFTPLNAKFMGKSIPDLNGVFIHANIISMNLNNDYIHKMPSWLNITLAVILVYMHIAFFIYYYIHKHIWFHLVFKIVQLVSSIVFIYVSIMSLFWFNLSLDFSLLLAGIIFSVDILYLYEGFANWLQKRYSIRTIYSNTHH